MEGSAWNKQDYVHKARMVWQNHKTAQIVTKVYIIKTTVSINMEQFQVNFVLV